MIPSCINNKNKNLEYRDEIFLPAPSRPIIQSINEGIALSYNQTFSVRSRAIMWLSLVWSTLDFVHMVSRWVSEALRSKSLIRTARIGTRSRTLPIGQSLPVVFIYCLLSQIGFFEWDMDLVWARLLLVRLYDQYNFMFSFVHEAKRKANTVFLGSLFIFFSGLCCKCFVWLLLMERRRGEWKILDIGTIADGLGFLAGFWAWFFWLYIQAQNSPWWMYVYMKRICQ